VPRAERNPYLFKSVDRALALLELVAHEREPRTAREIAEISGLERTTCYRLLSTLEHRRFVERDPVTQAYSLGLAATGLANTAAHHGALVRRARPVLEQLSKQVGQTVSLGVSQQWSAVVIDEVYPPNPIRVASYLNMPLPLHCTSNGKVILSRLNLVELDAYLARPLEQTTEHTVTDPRQLRDEVETVRERGFAVAINELVEGINAVSVPILDARTELVGTVTVSGLGYQLPPERLEELAKTLERAAHQIIESGG
jgi:IclR family transcriptional regulator, KDG regulon repressor